MKTAIKLETREEIEKFNDGLEEPAVGEPCLVNDMAGSICIHPLEDEELLRLIGYFICRLESVPMDKFPLQE